MAYIGTPGVPVRARAIALSLAAAGRRHASCHFFGSFAPLLLLLAAALLQKFVGWLTILGGAVLFTSNLDRMFGMMTGTVPAYVRASRCHRTRECRPLSFAAPRARFVFALLCSS